MIIFIGARKLVGKDTFADMLMGYLKMPTKKMSCIQGARDMVDSLFPLYDNYPKDDGHLMYNNQSYRDTVIDIVDACLKVDILCFSKDLVRQQSCSNEVFIVPDLRRIEEMKYFKETIPTQCKFILVENPRIEKTESYGEGSIDDPDLWDMVVYNDGTLDELRNKAKLIASHLELSF